MEIYYGLKISIHNELNSVPEETVNDVIYAIQNAGFKSLLDLQFVQEEHLMFILKPIPRRKLIKAWHKPGMIKELKYKYEKMKNQDVSWRIDEFLAQAKNSSGSSTSPVMMKSITDKLKKNIHRILDPISEEMVDNIIYALRYAGLELLLDLQFVREDDLPHVLDPIRRRKLLKAWSQQGNLFPFSSASAVGHGPLTVDRNVQDESNAVLRWPPNNASSSIPNLSVFAQRQASVGSSHMDTSQRLPNQFIPYIDQTYGLSQHEPPPKVFRYTDHGPLPPRPPPGVFHFTDHGPLPPGPPPGVFHFTDHGPLPPGPPPGVSHFTDHGLMPPRPPIEASSVASIGGEMTAFAELPSNGSLPGFTWVWKKRLALLRLYTRYKAELSSSGINKQSVWERIAHKVGRNNHYCDAEQCHNQIQIMKCEYESMKHIMPYELGQLQAVILDEAENAFENIENPVVFSAHSKPEKWFMSKSDRIQLLRVYAKYKAELLLQNFDIEKQIVWEKVAREVSKKCRTYYGKRWCCYEVNRLKNLYEIYKNKDLTKSGAPHFFNEARKSFECTEHTGQHGEINTLKDFSVKQERRDGFSPSNASSTIPDLSTVAQRQAPAESSHMDTSHSLPNQFSSYMGQTNGLSSPGVSGLTDDDVSPPGSPTGVYSLASIGGESIPPVNLYKLLFKYSKWKRSKCLVLLRAYQRYRTELSCPSGKENHDVWEKIAEEVHQRSSCVRCFKGKDSKRCSFVSGSQCMQQMEVLRLQYHELKNVNVLSNKMAKYFKTARNAFEKTENSVTIVAEPSSNVFLRSFKWLWKKRLALLRLYTIYKTELSSSNVDEQRIWKKIADEIGKKSLDCEANHCQNQLQDMKCEYERIKHSKPYELKELQAVFLDEAENAFENIENPVVFSVESNLEKWAMNRSDHVKLLQVYAKYKEELLLQNFDVEQQIVWGKVAREVSEKCSSFYGKRRCCFEIHNLKRLYENFKRRKEKNGKKKRPKHILPPYFFYEARKAFESTECTGQRQKVNSSKNFTVKQVSLENFTVKQESLENFTVKQESLENFTVKQETNTEEGERRDWYTHIAL